VQKITPEIVKTEIEPSEKHEKIRLMENAKIGKPLTGKKCLV
jgi:hypothetical protein